MGKSKLNAEVGDLIEELPPLYPALVQGGCSNVAPLPHSQLGNIDMQPVFEFDVAALD